MGIGIENVVTVDIDRLTRSLAKVTGQWIGRFLMERIRKEKEPTRIHQREVERVVARRGRRAKFSWNNPGFRGGAHTGNFAQGARPSTPVPAPQKTCEGCEKQTDYFAVCQACGKSLCISCFPWAGDCTICGKGST